MNRRCDVVGLVIALWAVLGCTERDPETLAEAAFARADYAVAKTRFVEALNRGASPRTAARVRARLGLTLRKLGELGRAESQLRLAIEQAVELADGELEAVARRYLGRVYFERGRYDPARSQYDQALAYHREHGPPEQLLRLLIQLAGLHWKRGEFQPAYNTYADALERARALGNRSLEAVSLDGLALVMNYFGEFAEADVLMLEAAEIHRETDNRDAAGASLGNRAVAAIELSRYGPARALAESELAAARASGNRLQQVQALSLIAESWRRQGDPARALKVVGEAIELGRVSGRQHMLDQAMLIEALAYEAAGALVKAEGSLRAFEALTHVDEATVALADGLAGRLAQQREDSATALARFRAADDRFERLRRRLGIERTSRFVTQSRAAIYDDFIRLLLDEKRDSEAIEVVGRVKARWFLDRLGSSGGANTPTRRPDSRQRILERGLNVERLVKAEPEQSALPAISALREKLPPGLVVLDFYLLPESVIVAWISRTSLDVRRVAAGRAEIGAQVSALRRAVTSRASTYTEPASWLSERLLGPFAARLVGSNRPQMLCIIPHGSLHGLPFEVLPVSDGLLVDQLPAVFAPSLPGLVVLLNRGAEPGDPTRVSVFGDVTGDLPGARAESLQFAKRVAHASIFLGEAATETQARRELPQSDIVHFAVHGHDSNGREEAFLELRGDESHDGRLYADEVATLSVRARLVTLSACETGVGKPIHGDELLGVLGRAFLHAGAHSVISTRWGVSDVAARRFMAIFYRELPRRGRLLAFGEAQRAFRRGLVAGPLGADSERLARLNRGVRPHDPGAAAIDLSHPFYWAGFFLEGDYR